MGNSQSPSSHKDPRFASSSRVLSRTFSHTELEDLKSLHASLAAQSQSNGPYVSRSVFKNYFGLHDPLGDRMLDLVIQQREDQKLTFEDLVIAKGIYGREQKMRLKNSYVSC